MLWNSSVRREVVVFFLDETISVHDEQVIEFLTVVNRNSDQSDSIDCFFSRFVQQRLLVEKINQQLSEQIQLNLVQPPPPTQTATSNSDVIKQIQVKLIETKKRLSRALFLQ